MLSFIIKSMKLNLQKQKHEQAEGKKKYQVNFKLIRKSYTRTNKLLWRIRFSAWASIQTLRSPWHFLRCVRLLILFAFSRAGGRNRLWPVDIYKLIWQRVMAFYKRNRARCYFAKAGAVRCKCLLLYSSQLKLNLFDCVPTSFINFSRTKALITGNPTPCNWHGNNAPTYGWVCPKSF